MSTHFDGGGGTSGNAYSLSPTAAATTPSQRVTDSYVQWSTCDETEDQMARNLERFVGTLRTSLPFIPENVTLVV